MQMRSYGSVKVWSLDLPEVLRWLRTAARALIDADEAVLRVILFGSLVKGNYTAHSDADICVILSGADPRRQMDRIPQYKAHFLGAPVPVDVLVYAEAEIAQMRADGSRFVREAVDEGTLLAER